MSGEKWSNGAESNGGAKDWKEVSPAGAGLERSGGLGKSKGLIRDWIPGVGRGPGEPGSG